MLTIYHHDEHSKITVSGLKHRNNHSLAPIKSCAMFTQNIKCFPIVDKARKELARLASIQSFEAKENGHADNDVNLYIEFHLDRITFSVDIF